MDWSLPIILFSFHKIDQQYTLIVLDKDILLVILCWASHLPICTVEGRDLLERDGRHRIETAGQKCWCCSMGLELSGGEPIGFTNIYALPSERSPKCLNSNNGEDDPKEQHKESDLYQERCSFLQRPQNCLEISLLRNKVYACSFRDSE